MLDFIVALIEIFGKFVKMFFELPFYGNVTYGYLLLGISITAMVFYFLISRMR